ncbi:MAG TPA: hypothetical protein EYP41_10415 [Anaerolineae bacterium]|nr:hypothetical protein [Anaerolineae bacterium]HIP72751.1 hypothetical protein [Anaerolineae bacterium]
MTTITLNLPGRLIQRAEQASLVLQKPVEDILTDLLDVTLPDTTDAPPELQADLARMTWMDNQALWQIARDQMDTQSESRLRTLAQLQDERALTAVERTELDNLRREYGRITLLKSRAYALLSLRGGEPLLKKPAV